MRNEKDTKALKDFIDSIDEARTRVKVLRAVLSNMVVSDTVDISNLTFLREGYSTPDYTRLTVPYTDIKPFVERELAAKEAWLAEAEISLKVMRRICGLKEEENGQ